MLSAEDLLMLLADMDRALGHVDAEDPVTESFQGTIFPSMPTAILLLVRNISTKLVASADTD